MRPEDITLLVEVMLCLTSTLIEPFERISVAAHYGLASGVMPIMPVETDELFSQHKLSFWKEHHLSSRLPESSDKERYHAIWRGYPPAGSAQMPGYESLAKVTLEAHMTFNFGRYRHVSLRGFTQADAATSPFSLRMNVEGAMLLADVVTAAVQAIGYRGTGFRGRGRYLVKHPWQRLEKYGAEAKILYNERAAVKRGRRLINTRVLPLL